VQRLEQAHSVRDHVARYIRLEVWVLEEILLSAFPLLDLDGLLTGQILT
jgi:hypothetical protein